MIHGRTISVVAVFVLTLALAALPDSGTNQVGAVSPCANGNCETRSVSAFNLFSGSSQLGAAQEADVNTASVEEILEKGLALSEMSPVHLAFRGATTDGGVRCDWRGIARTAQQREQAVRFWLDLEQSEPLPPADEVERRFMVEFDRINPIYPETVRANFRAIARGGLSQDYQFLTCYVDFTVHEYLLGSGPTDTTLTVAYDRMGESRSFELYIRAHGAGEFGNEALMTRGEYEAHLDQFAFDLELFLGLLMEGRENVLFLAPMGSHNAVGIEAWQAVTQWDLQTADDDTVNAVRYGTSEQDPEHVQTLANLTTRVTTAATTDSFADDRISSPTGLTQEYRDIGAYDDIIPDDGSTDTFTPAQPPPMPTCALGTAVASPETDRGLVHDCGSLLAAKSTLAGTATLNWGTATASTSWDGVTISGTPSRVTGLALASKSLTGTISADLGELFELTTLNLSSNQLTGAIPDELGWLHNLTELRLTGNQLTGCMPVVLEDVATNDLSSLNLLYCQPPAPENLAVASPMEFSLTPSWDTVSNTTKYRLEYRPAGVGSWTVEDETLTGTSSTVENLPCKTEYQFRVSAYGSGTTYTAAWSEATPAITISTTECVSPVFPLNNMFTLGYSFPAGRELRTVMAEDPNRDQIMYAIINGNDAGLFNINSTTGTVSVAARVSIDLLPITLTIQARDPAGNTGQAQLTVDDPPTYAESCALYEPVEEPDMNPDLVEDCAATFEAGLALDGNLFWDLSTPMSDWYGVTIGGTPKRVTAVSVANRWLSGRIPSTLGSLTALTTLDLSNNQLTGGIPRELEDLTNLTTLRLSGNQLTGCIPFRLQNIGTHDLDSMGLPYCPPPAPANLTKGTIAETTAHLSWNSVDNASKYRTEYRVSGTATWTAEDDTITGTSHTVKGLTCNTRYQFQVSAYGDGVGHAEAWGTPTRPSYGTTTACVSPVFGETSYGFSVLENAAVGASVGTVSATDPTDDDVAYSITAGNESGKFTIGSSSGEITVAGSLDYTTEDSYSLTVKAADVNNHYAAVTAEIIVLRQVTVSFGQAEYSVDEDATSGVEITVVLSADAGREVTVPITTTHQGGTTSEDYTAIQASVTFGSGETTKTLQIVPVDDTVVDNDESIVFNFGTLPQGVTAGTPATATVTIQDNDVPHPVTLWTTTMTVGNYGGYLGYSTLSEPAVGSLSDDDFTWNGTTYTVTNILYNMYFDHLSIDFSTTLAGDVAGLTVHLDGLQLNMEDSTRGYRQPGWTPVILNWNVGDTVEVSLVYTASEN